LKAKLPFHLFATQAKSYTTYIPGTIYISASAAKVAHMTNKYFKIKSQEIPP